MFKQLITILTGKLPVRMIYVSWKSEPHPLPRELYEDVNYFSTRTLEMKDEYYESLKKKINKI